jgi:hypothetical protein
LCLFERFVIIPVDEDWCHPRPGVKCLPSLPSGICEGRCSEFVGLFGCSIFVRDGARGAGPVVGALGCAKEICVD